MPYFSRSRKAFKDLAFELNRDGHRTVESSASI